VALADIAWCGGSGNLGDGLMQGRLVVFDLNDQGDGGVGSNF
jgi:hypothetical protein